MKATGVVRRIDDLGRVVIPKEIRRTLRIGEGSPLEIYTDKDGEIVLKKYSPIGELGDFASDYAETLSKTSGTAVVITDKDSIIAVYGAPKKELVEKRISEDVEKVLERKSIFSIDMSSSGAMPVVDGTEKYFASVVAPIVSEGDTIGSVIMVSENERTSIGEVEKKLCQSAAGFLGKHMEAN